MTLGLYTSKTRAHEPNLVAVQDPRLFRLATVLVCPLKRDALMTHLRPKILWNDEDFVVLCDLVRPIHRRVLRHMGETSVEDGERVLSAFQILLAKD